MAKRNREETLRLRVHADFKKEVEDIASLLDMSASALARQALREYIARHLPNRLNEPPAGYTAAKPTPPPPSSTARCAAAARRTSFYSVTRQG